MSKKAKTPPNTIAVNRKARYDYHIEETFEAGIVLSGWEVKSIRAAKVQMVDSHVVVHRNELWLLNAHITPLLSASTHVEPEPTRSRKLLLHRRQIDRLCGQVAQQGYTIVPLSLYWGGRNVKVKIALVKGKKLHDKRASEKSRDWDRQKQRILRNN